MDDQNVKDGQPKVPPTTPDPVTPPTTPVTPVAPEAPIEPVTPPATETETPQPVQDLGYTETKSSKLLYILVFVLVVILLSLVGLFFYKQVLSTPGTAEVSPTPVVQVSPEVSPSLTPANEEEADLQQLEIPDIEEDLKEIEMDLEQL